MALSSCPTRAWPALPRCGSGSATRLRRSSATDREDDPHPKMSPVELPSLLVDARRPAEAPDDRERLVRRAKALAWLGVGWHGIEAAISIGAGIAAGSIALVGFGADSLVEAFAGFIVLWRFP